MYYEPQKFNFLLFRFLIYFIAITTLSQYNGQESKHWYMTKLLLNNNTKPGHGQLSFPVAGGLRTAGRIFLSSYIKLSV